MDAVEDRKLRPLLKAVRLRSATFSNDFFGLPGMRFRVARSISIGVGPREEVEAEVELVHKKAKKKTRKSAQENVEDKPLLEGIVDIALTASFESQSGEKVDSIVATATYRGHFGFNKESRLSDIEDALELEPYQYHFVAQAYPVAMRHFTAQLRAMGMSTNNVPLGIT